MTTSPSVKGGDDLLPGLVAVGLFAVLAYVFWSAPFDDAQGFPAGESITENIGYLMFNLGDLPAANIPGEGFLVSFILVAVVLDAALEGGLFLAKRESEGSVVTALRSGREAKTDGGTPEDGAPGESPGDATDATDGGED